MLINKWLITDSGDLDKGKEAQAGLCLYLDGELNDIDSLCKFLQTLPIEKAFSILLSGDNLDLEKTSDAFIEKVIALFFQPCYYIVNHQPLVFLSSLTPACMDFLDRLKKKSIGQGFKDILLLETKTSDSMERKIEQFAYLITGSDFNHALLIKNWVTQYLENRNPTEIHFLVSAKEKEISGIFNEMLQKEKLLQETEDYKIATSFYQKQKLIESYKYELLLKTINEKDLRMYLSILKENSANNLKWYHNEYEILPLWYKRLGHLIKVLMGKRTFRSLFNDNVKKYKD